MNSPMEREEVSLLSILRAIQDKWCAMHGEWDGSKMPLSELAAAVEKDWLLTPRPPEKSVAKSDTTTDDARTVLLNQIYPLIIRRKKQLENEEYDEGAREYLKLFQESVRSQFSHEHGTCTNDKVQMGDDSSL